MSIDNKILDILISEQANDFDKVDELLLNKGLPKDISKIIFDYSASCVNCNNCCKLCRFYCYDRCLRYNDNGIYRSVCCRYELQRDLTTIMLKKGKVIGNSIETDDQNANIP